jgi:hypothetical protein
VPIPVCPFSWQKENNKAINKANLTFIETKIALAKIRLAIKLTKN